MLANSVHAHYTGAIESQQESEVSSTDKRKQALRHDIMNVVKANGLEVSGDFWFMLIFRSEAELKGIARDLHIRVA